jgi:hypothetical protein
MERFEIFATKRLVVGVALALAAVWIFMTVLGFFDPQEVSRSAASTGLHQSANPASNAGAAVHGAAPGAKAARASLPAATATAAAGHGSAADPAGEEEPAPPTTTGHGAPAKQGSAAHAPAAATAPHPPAAPALARGVAFVDAAIRPLEYELRERFWGWRPNDILDFTDNVNEYQLGVLEVTRRTAVILAERISRTGSTASFDHNLEQAMNWFMIKAESYWFPTPESKYKDGLDEFRAYREKLVRGEARFFTRTDNLIPLLSAYEDLLGSCEENLVKTREDDGSEVSFFDADNYFYYAQGVASALVPLLEAVAVDFGTVVESRRGSEVLHHAIESSREASEIHPWIITDSDLDGILANHRANLAAPLSHARFFLGVLIKTLST